MVFTDRHGGVSAAPFESLNLAIDGGDAPASRAANLDILLSHFAPGDQLADLKQVHGCEVVDALGAGRSVADGLVTTQSNLVLVVRAADCVPMLLASEQGVIGAVHVGRKGLASGVAPRAVARMRELGAKQIRAWLGPHVCGRCYEVPLELQQQVAMSVPESVSSTSQGTPSLDLAAGLLAQLSNNDVQVEFVGGCTYESQDLYSFRRDGANAGRQGGLIRMPG